jgi:1,4-dihydroxy-2-naphthoate octaprenyltransferase
LGVGIADYLRYPIDWSGFWLGLVWVLSMQLTTHYLNEYFDTPADATNSNRTPFSGGSGVLGEGEGRLPRWAALLAAATTLTVATLATYSLLLSGRLNLLSGIVLLLIFLGAVFYSLPPVQLSHSGYGELTAAVVVGNLVPTLGFVLQTKELHRLLGVTTFPLTLLGLALLVAVSLPDYATDLKFDKRNLLVRAGWQAGMTLHNVFILSAFLLFGLAPFLDLPVRVALLAFVTLPLGFFQVWQVSRIASGHKPNWLMFTWGAVLLFGLTAAVLAFAFWTQ